MKTVLTTPTEERVKTACMKFDQDQDVLLVEQSLKELFDQFPGNNDLPHVLLKVVALNRLYSTQIFAVVDVARHIHRNAQAIDAALAAGSPGIVETIAKVTVTVSGKERNNYSFATKYCSWHNPASYPIYDSRVDRYLWKLQKQDRFATFFLTNADLWDYAKFRDVTMAFRDFYGLGSFSFFPLNILESTISTGQEDQK